MVKEMMSRFSKRELVEIYDKLNVWEWDNRLGEKPENWDSILDFTLGNQHKGIQTKKKLIDPYLEYIYNNTTEKERLKYHHINNCEMTMFQHEVWWFKRSFCKLFQVGWYSKKNKQLLVEALTNIATEQKQEKMKDIYK